MEAIKRIIEDSALTIHINRDKRDQVFEFMEDQEKEIKDLQEANDKLGRTASELLAGLRWEKDQNEKLEEKNKKLSDLSLRSIFAVNEWEKSVGDYSIETPSELESWLEASIHEDDECYSKYVDPIVLREECGELQDEIKKLKSEAEDTKRLLTVATNHGGVLRRQNQELKEGLKDYEQHAILEEDINDYVERVLGQKLVDRKEYAEYQEGLKGECGKCGQEFVGGEKIDDGMGCRDCCPDE
tara:strand:+ start:775 stop:1500 length:726 start_codon:yes stop_codon:yes gene_type:complete